MSYLLPQFKCQPEVFAIHFRSHHYLAYLAKSKDSICLQPQCSLSTTSHSSSLETTLPYLHNVRMPSLDARFDPLVIEKPWEYFGKFESLNEVLFSSALTTETLITDEAVVAAASAEAITLARAAAKVAKDVAQIMCKSGTINEDSKHYYSSTSYQGWPRLTNEERAHILEDAKEVGIESSSPSSQEVNILEPTHEELELIEKQPSDVVAVRSRRHAERKAKRVRASEKSVSSIVSLKCRSSGRKKRAPLHEVDFSDPLRYLRSTTGSARLLTAREELLLSEGIQDLLKLENLHQQLAERFGAEPTFAQWAAAVGVDQKTLRKRLNDAVMCKEKMIKSNIRLVISIAKHYRGAGLNLQDLVQEGCRGLVRSAEKFDASKGFKFSTYAHWWIKQSVRKSLSDQSRTIRLPFHIVEASYKVREARRLLSSKGGHPNDEELAEAAGLSLRRLNTILLAPKWTLSLDQKTGMNANLKPSEVVTHPDSESPEEAVMRQWRREEVETVLGGLNPRERTVVRCRFGLEDGRTKTLQEIGETMGVSRERIRQLEIAALRKLKSSSSAKLLARYVS